MSTQPPRVLQWCPSLNWWSSRRPTSMIWTHVSMPASGPGTPLRSRAYLSLVVNHVCKCPCPTGTPLGNRWWGNWPSTWQWTEWATTVRRRATLWSKPWRSVLTPPGKVHACLRGSRFQIPALPCPDQRFRQLQPLHQRHDAAGRGWPLQGLSEHLGLGHQRRRKQADHLWRLNASSQTAYRHQVLQGHAQAVQTWSALQGEGEASECGCSCPFELCLLSALHPSLFRLKWPTPMGAPLTGWKCASRQNWPLKPTCTPANWSPRTARQPLRSLQSPPLPSMCGWRLVAAVGFSEASPLECQTEFCVFMFVCHRPKWRP